MLRIEDITYAVEGRPLFDGASATIPDRSQGWSCGPQRHRQDHPVPSDPGRTGAGIGQYLGPQTRPDRRCGARGALVRCLADQHGAGRRYRTQRVDGRGRKRQDPARIAEIQTRLADIDAWSAEARAASILKGLGFDDEDQQRPCSDFSGGWRMRVALAAVCCLRSPICCCWTNRPTIWTLKARCGWKAIWRSTRIRSSSSATTGAVEPRGGLDPASGRSQADLLRGAL